MKNKKLLKILIPCILSVCLILAAAPFVFKDKPILQDDIPTGKPQILGLTDLRIRGLENNQESAPIQKIKEPNLIGVSAKSVLIYDLNSKQVLISKNSKDKTPIASLTKLLTAYVTYKNVDLDSIVTIDPTDSTDFSPKLNLLVQDKIKVVDLFNAMLVGSGNDAALALARFVGIETRQNFIKLMNETAKSLGMQDSNFANPTGFDNYNNFSSAEDLKKLVDTTQLLAVFTNLGKKQKYEFQSLLGNNYKIDSTNRLLASNPDIESVKSGFTETAKGSLITKMTINGRKIIFIILNSDDREKDTLTLRKKVMENFSF